MRDALAAVLQRLPPPAAPGVGYSPATGRVIVARIVQRMGPMEIVLHTVVAVPRSADGGVHAVTCELTPEARAAVVRRARGETEGAS